MPGLRMEQSRNLGWWRSGSLLGVKECMIRRVLIVKIAEDNPKPRAAECGPVVTSVFKAIIDRLEKGGWVVIHWFRLLHL